MAERLLLSMSRRVLSVADGPGDSPERWAEECASAHGAIADVPGRDEDCSICLSSMTDGCVRTPCDHYFHGACLGRYLAVARSAWVSASCPLCRGGLHGASQVRVRAMSGRPLEVVPLPARGGRCHLDRSYCFLSLGGFARLPGLVYFLLSCNEDRHSAPERSMWLLALPFRATLHLNFRSERHVHGRGVAAWLARERWSRNPAIASAVSSGVPNGPYSGPVFSKTFEQGEVRLSGSGTWEGVYFVFVQLEDPEVQLEDSEAAAGSGATYADPGGASGGGVAHAMQSVEEAPEEDPESHALPTGEEEEEEVVVRGRGAPAELRAVARRAVRWAAAAATAGAALGAAAAHAVVGSTTG